MKTIHISYGGPDRRIRDATGKVWRFEMHPYCGSGVRDLAGGAMHQFALQFFAMSRLTVFRSGHGVLSVLTRHPAGAVA